MCLNMVKTSLHEIWFHFSNMRFSTKDQDNDSNNNRHCSQHFNGAWWYAACHRSNLNGLYLNGSHKSNANGVNWFHFRGHRYSLKRTEMKVRTKRQCLSQDNALIKSRLQHPPQETLGHLTVVLFKGWEIEPCLGGVGNLSGPAKSFQRNTRILFFSMKLFKGKEFTFAKRWLRRKGLQESYIGWSFFLQKNCVNRTQFWPRGTGIWRSQSLKA